MAWIITICIAVAFLIIWGLSPSEKTSDPYKLVKYDGYEKNTKTEFKPGRDASGSYDANTGRISIDYGTPDRVREVIIDYTVTYIAPGGKEYIYKIKPNSFTRPEFDVGTFGFLNESGRFIAVEDQKKAEVDFKNEHEKILNEKREANRLVEERRNKLPFRILRRILFFVCHLFLVIFAANLSIAMPQISRWLALYSENIVSESSAIAFIITTILSILLLLFSALLLYIFNFGNILVVPLITIFILKEQPFFAPFFKSLSTILIGIVISYYTGNALESKLNNIGFTLIDIPYFGSMTKNVTFCALIAILILSIIFFFIHLENKSLEKYRSKKEKEMNEHLERYRK